jgi:starch phosphorylase
MVRESIMHHAPQFSTHRMVQDYTRQAYVPASEAFGKVSANGSALAKDALSWRDKVQSNWGQVSVVSVNDSVGLSNPIGDEFSVTARVRLGALSPAEVRVQAVSGKVGSNRELTNTSVIDLSFGEKDGEDFVYAGQLKCDQPGHQGYTVRIIPFHPNVSVPAELNLVHWK